MSSFTNNWKIIFGITLGVVVFPLFAYWTIFGSSQLSNEFEEWVDFSTFWSPYLITALTIILTYISWQNLELMKLKEKPILVVERIPGKVKLKDEKDRWYWKVKNIGSGPALEVKLFIDPEKPHKGFDPFLKSKGLGDEHILPQKETEYEYFVHSISITPNNEVVIDWHLDLNKLSVTYSDLNGKKYVITTTKYGKEVPDGIVLSINEQGEFNGKALFSRGQKTDRSKRIFSIGECFIPTEYVV